MSRRRAATLTDRQFERISRALAEPRRFDISPVVVFLASDDSGWLTGERITAAGGYR